MKRNFSFILRLFVSIGLVFAIFKFIPYEQLLLTYRHAKKIYIFIGLSLFSFSSLCGVARWKFLLSSLKIKVSWREAFYVSLAGTFFNLFFPSCLAGDIFRGFSISSRYGDAKKVASSVLMDRFSGVTALTILAIFSYFMGKSLLLPPEVPFSLGILSLAVVLAALIIFSRTLFNFLAGVFKHGSLLKSKLTAFHDQLYFFKQNPRMFIKALLFSFPIQAVVILGFFSVAKAFSVDAGIIYFFILVPLIMVIAFIPVTIAGIGTREAAAVYFFSLIGIEKSVGLGISLINLVFLVFIGIAGGLLYLSMHHKWVQACS